MRSPRHLLAIVFVLTSGTSLWADSLQTNTVFYQEVSWSPDGTKLAFTAMVNQRPSEIYTMVLRGKVVNRLTENDAPDAWTSWSKDGAQLYFNSKRDGNDEIYVMKSNGGGAKRLTDNPARDVAPSLSPDGTEIAFISDRDGNEEVYIMSADGTKIERLTSTPAREHNPHWSPDGQRIVCYTSSDGAKDQVVLIDAASGDARTIGSDTTANTYPSWSADGNSIIYGCAPTKDEKWIYSATLDGSKNDKLLPLTAFYASYSPDGKRIAYVGGSWPASNIYVIDYTDGTLRCLTCDVVLEPPSSGEIANQKSKKRP